MGLLDRLKTGWNAFIGRDPTKYLTYDAGYSMRPDRMRFSRGNERTIVTSIYNRISLDASAIKIRHVRLDKTDRFIEYIHSGLDNCLTLEANMDQTGRAFLQDVVQSMLDEGCVAIVPTDTSVNPNVSSFDVTELRTGKIVTWYPDKVKVSVYNERLGKREELLLPKKLVGIIENPLYAVINEPNSTMQRLIRKLSLLDNIDEQYGSRKLNMILQFPYVIRTEAQKRRAESRRKMIEEQLAGSEYGIAYTDGTEKIMQLGRPLENNLMDQIKYLTETLYGQLGITPEILNGSANEQVMLNYYDRTIEPIVAAIVDELKRKFLTPTARTQRQSIMYFRDPFKLVPVANLADIADKFTRNEIMTSNEFRQVLGMKPSDDPKADQLVNSNMPIGDTGVGMQPGMEGGEEYSDEEYADEGYEEGEEYEEGAGEGIEPAPPGKFDISKIKLPGL